jgi:regulatory protein
MRRGDMSAARAAGATSAADNSADPENAARLIALRLLESAPRTRAELERALARRAVPADAATAVLDRFADVGLIDDEAFAQAWVTSRHAGRGLGRRALSAELRRRGVDAETTAAAVDAVSADDEEAAARALVARRLRAMGGLPPDTQMRRLAGMLARKGFGHALAVQVVREEIAAQRAVATQAD